MTQHVFDPADASEAATEAYRPLHRFAIPACVLAAAGLVAIWVPLVAIVSLVALGLGAVALVQIVRRPEDLSGKVWAAIGVAVAAFTLGLAPMRTSTRQGYLFDAAQKAGDSWLRLLADDRLYEAHQLTLEPSERQPADADLAAYYENPRSAEERDAAKPTPFDDVPPEPSEIVAEYAKRPLVADLLAAEAATWTYRGRGQYINDAMNSTEYLDLKYDLELSGGPSGARTIPIVLRLARFDIAAQRTAAWRIAGIERAKEL